MSQCVARLPRVPYGEPSIPSAGCRTRKLRGPNGLLSLTSYPPASFDTSSRLPPVSPRMTRSPRCGMTGPYDRNVWRTRHRSSRWATSNYTRSQPRTSFVPADGRSDDTWPLGLEEDCTVFNVPLAVCVRTSQTTVPRYALYLPRRARSDSPDL